MINANYECEYKNHKTFNKENDKQYIEVHHLIPMKEQNRMITKPLDREENIVCLCPNCHREIHYGKNRNIIIKALYEKRINKLKKAEIDIDLKTLYSYYKK